MVIYSRNRALFLKKIVIQSLDNLFLTANLKFEVRRLLKEILSVCACENVFKRDREKFSWIDIPQKEDEDNIVIFITRK